MGGGRGGLLAGWRQLEGVSRRCFGYPSRPLCPLRRKKVEAEVEAPVRALNAYAPYQTPVHPGAETPVHPGMMTPVHPGMMTPVHPGAATPVHPGLRTGRRAWACLLVLGTTVPLLPWRIAFESHNELGRLFDATRTRTPPPPGMTPIRSAFPPTTPAPPPIVVKKEGRLSLSLPAARFSFIHGDHTIPTNSLGGT